MSTIYQDGTNLNYESFFNDPNFQRLLAFTMKSLMSDKDEKSVAPGSQNSSVETHPPTPNTRESDYFASQSTENSSATYKPLPKCSSEYKADDKACASSERGVRLNRMTKDFMKLLIRMLQLKLLGTSTVQMKNPLGLNSS